MNNLIFNFIVINFSLTITYFAYKIFFSRDTFLNLKRYYLKYGVVFAILLPLIDVSGFINPESKLLGFAANQSFLLPEVTVLTNDRAYYDINQILLGLYFIICSILLLRFLVGFVKILNIKSRGKIANLNGIKVIVLNDKIAPFSFLNWVFLNPDLHSKTELDQILSHELIHVNQKHTVDVILSELSAIIFWINPVIWLIKKEIRENLEFIADNKVLDSGIDTKKYQYHLLKLSYQSPDLKLSNNFNISPLKKRIKMMNREKSRKVSAAKYLLVIPLAFALILIGNLKAIANTVQSMNISSVQDTERNEIQNFTQTTQTEVSREIRNPEPVVEKQKELKQSNAISEVTVVGYSPNANVIPADETKKTDDNTVFMVVEKMPEFPGGQAELMKYLSQTVRYPVKAQELGKQGRVIVTFIVNADGSIDDDIKVVRSADTALDNEAIRVIKSMPNWTPGTQRGKAVRVNFTLPINFRLDGGENKPKPLIVVDGLEQAADFDFNSIDSGTVESVNVLKSEESIKSYGEKGKNGVIIITLKK